jgi:hypothetical protein
MVLKQIFSKKDQMHGLDLSGRGQGILDGCFERIHKPSISIKYGEFDCLWKCQL